MPVKPPIVSAYNLVHDYLEVDPAELRKHLGRLKDFERYCRYVVEYLRL